MKLKKQIQHLFHSETKCEQEKVRQAILLLAEKIDKLEGGEL